MTDEIEKGTTQHAPPPTAEAPETPAALAVDPHNRAAVAGALVLALRRAGITARATPARRQHDPVIVATAAGILHQSLALLPDENRANLYAWHWVWGDGLRGEDGAEYERICDGEDIDTCKTSLARVLGLNGVRG